VDNTIIEIIQVNLQIINITELDTKFNASKKYKLEYSVKRSYISDNFDNIRVQTQQGA
jgi:hypothetical protein